MDAILRQINGDLKNCVVLTELASNAYKWTPILASLYGAKEVIAVHKNNSFGTFENKEKELTKLQKVYKINNIHITTKPMIEFASVANLVTNAGQVRPITKEFLEKMPKKSAIALMFEPWEVRSDDINLETAKQLKVPIIGTNESDERIRTLHYLGELAYTLWRDCSKKRKEVKIGVIASPKFEKHIIASFRQRGIEAKALALIEDTQHRVYDSQCCNFVIIADIDNPKAIHLQKSLVTSFEIIHIAGQLSVNTLSHYPVKPFPIAPFGFMTRNTGYLGVEPVLRLNAGSLIAAGIVVKALQQGLPLNCAYDLTTQSGLGLPLYQ